MKKDFQLAATLKYVIHILLVFVMISQAIGMLHSNPVDTQIVNDADEKKDSSKKEDSKEGKEYIMHNHDLQVSIMDNIIFMIPSAVIFSSPDTSRPAPPPDKA